MGPLGWLMAAGTAFSIPPVIDAIDRLTGDLWDADWLGRRGRQAKMRGFQAVDQMLEDVDFHRNLANERDLEGWMAPLGGLRGLGENTPYQQIQNQRGLMGVLQREQKHLGEMAEIDTGPDFEALALQMGY